MSVPKLAKVTCAFVSVRAYMCACVRLNPKRKKNNNKPRGRERQSICVNALVCVRVSLNSKKGKEDDGRFRWLSGGHPYSCGPQILSRIHPVLKPGGTRHGTLTKYTTGKGRRKGRNEGQKGKGYPEM